MIFVFLDDGTLDVIESPEIAQRNYEGIDVESDIYAFYDSEGNYLKPQFIVPNKSGKFLGLFQWYKSGRFRLISDPEKCKNPIGVKLLEATQVNSNKWFNSLDDVKRYLKPKGIVIEKPD